jgi:hypothetical protein
MSQLVLGFVFLITISVIYGFMKKNSFHPYFSPLNFSVKIILTKQNRQIWLTILKAGTTFAKNYYSSFVWAKFSQKIPI